MIKLQMNRRQVIILSVLLIAITIFISYLLLSKAENKPYTTEKLESSVNYMKEATSVPDEEAGLISTNNIEDATPEPNEEIVLTVDMLTQIERQNHIDEFLLAELDSGAYSFEDPLVIVDPYGISPLTALVLFTSDVPLNVSVYVPGKTDLADVSFTFDGYSSRHMVPVYGLYPDAVNLVSLSAHELNGTTKSIILELQTDPLPLWLESTIIITDMVQHDNYQPGFNFTFSRKSAFDANGEYRWYYYDERLQQATLYDYNGNVILAKGSADEGNVILFEVNALGKILSVYYSPYGAHHDIISIDSGNLIVSGGHGKTVEDFIYEISVDDGKIVNSIDLKRILQRTRSNNAPEYSTSDWFHHNATCYIDGRIIISGRRQSAVVNLSWPTGELVWILADHSGWNSMFEKYLLTPIGSDFEWSYCQHAPEILPDYDNNPDTIDILLFDNGNTRFTTDTVLQRFVSNNEIVAPELYSRMVHYRINEKDMTIEQIWQFGKELGYPYYSAWRGDANLLINGNRLGTFDRLLDEYGGDFNTSIIEVDVDGNIVWEAYATSTSGKGEFAAYRCERLPLYTAAANNLLIGVPARVFIPEDKLP